LGKRIGSRFFLQLVDAIQVPVWMVNTAGRSIFGNQRWTELIDDPNDVATGGRMWTDALHPDDRGRANIAFQAAVSAGETFALDVRLRAPNGTYRWVACTASPQVAIDGRVESYIGICADISARREAEWALRGLRAKMVEAQESERSRIARELHDDLGQQAAMLATKFELLLNAPTRSRRDLVEGLIDVQQHLQQLAIGIHDLSHQLHPAKLKMLGLVNTLESLCRQVSREAGVHVQFTAQQVPGDIPERLALCVYRVAQEALQNATKHSGVRDIAVMLSAAAGTLTLRVVDHGRGLDPLRSDAAGIGLLTMRERVELNGGAFRIETAPSTGTTIEATLPLAQSAEDAANAKARRIDGAPQSNSDLWKRVFASLGQPKTRRGRPQARAHDKV
jgi:PAS domain S-box-containing protein